MAKPEWFRLNVDAHDDLKWAMLKAQHGQARMEHLWWAWCRSLAWSQEQLTDGLLPVEKLGVDDALECANDLRLAGLLDGPRDDLWTLHNFAKYQTSKKKWLQKQEQRAAASKKAAEKRRAKAEKRLRFRAVPDDDQKSTDSVSGSVNFKFTAPTPTPTLSDSGSESRKRDVAGGTEVPGPAAALVLSFPSLAASGSGSVPSSTGDASAPALEELSSRYEAGLLAQAREVCALSRRSGRMADSVWLATLRRMARIDLWKCEDGMRIFLLKPTSERRDERYMIGIINRTQPGEYARQTARVSLCAPPATAVARRPDGKEWVCAPNVPDGRRGYSQNGST